MNTPLIEDNLAQLKSEFSGQLLTPSDAGYDAARQIWNGMIDKRPALIAQCANTADVVQALRYARSEELPVSVKGGGHNVAGRAICEGLVIDLSLMKKCEVDPQSRTVAAEAGVTWGEFDAKTEAHKLAVTGGAVSSTGIAGLTLGGGVGWLRGRFGTVADNLISAEVVTADGEVLTASADENEELFWGIRGGGGNFGVVTSFKYRLHLLEGVLGGMTVYPMERLGDVLRFFRSFTADLPDELSVMAGALHGPDGSPLCALIVCYSGPDLGEGERMLEPLRSFGPPLMDTIARVPYTQHQQMFDHAVPHGQLSYWKSAQIKELTDEAIDQMAKIIPTVTSKQSVVLLETNHGAMTRVPENTTAFPHRNKSYDLVIMAFWNNPSETETHIGWTRGFYTSMQPHYSGGVYVNTLGDDEATDRVRAAYGPNYDRLLRLKRKYDPDNVFCNTQNIRP